MNETKSCSVICLTLGGLDSERLQYGLFKT